MVVGYVGDGHDVEEVGCRNTDTEVLESMGNQRCKDL